MGYKFLQTAFKWAKMLPRVYDGSNALWKYMMAAMLFKKWLMAEMITKSWRQISAISGWWWQKLLVLFLLRFSEMMLVMMIDEQKRREDAFPFSRPTWLPRALSFAETHKWGNISQRKRKAWKDTPKKLGMYVQQSQSNVMPWGSAEI